MFASRFLSLSRAVVFQHAFPVPSAVIVGSFDSDFVEMYYRLQQVCFLLPA
jgi:hypothetical protein